MRHDDTLADLSAELPVRAQAHVGLQLLWLAEAWERLSTEESLQAYLSRQQRLVDGVDSWDVAAMRTLRSEILRAGYLAMRSGESVAPEVGGVEHLTLVQLGDAELVTGDSTSLAQALLGLTGLDAANPVAIPWRDEVAAALRAAQQGAGAEAVREALRPVRQRMEQVLPAWLEDRRRYLAPMSRGSGADPYAAVAAASQASPTTMLDKGLVLMWAVEPVEAVLAPAVCDTYRRWRATLEQCTPWDARPATAVRRDVLRHPRRPWAGDVEQRLRRMVLGAAEARAERTGDLRPLLVALDQLLSGYDVDVFPEIGWALRVTKASSARRRMSPVRDRLAAQLAAGVTWG